MLEKSINVFKKEKNNIIPKKSLTKIYGGTSTTDDKIDVSSEKPMVIRFS